MRQFAKCCYTNIKLGSFAGLCVVSAVGISGGAAFAQSAPSGGSDSAYLNALGTMVLDMDLDGLASQTFEPESVAAPTLSVMVSGNGAMDHCSAVLAMSEANGTPIEIFGANAALTSEQRAALSECLMPETGTVMSYLMPDN